MVTTTSVLSWRQPWQDPVQWPEQPTRERSSAGGGGGRALEVGAVKTVRWHGRRVSLDRRPSGDTKDPVRRGASAREDAVPGEPPLPARHAEGQAWAQEGSGAEKRRSRRTRLQGGKKGKRSNTVASGSRGDSAT